jgi:hypothetical protein
MPTMRAEDMVAPGLTNAENPAWACRSKGMKGQLPSDAELSRCSVGAVSICKETKGEYDPAKDSSSAFTDCGKQARSFGVVDQPDSICHPDEHMHPADEHLRPMSSRPSWRVSKDDKGSSKR